MVNDSIEGFTVIALGTVDNSFEIGTGGLFIVGSEKISNTVHGESINHKGSILACTKTLDAVQNPVVKLYLMNCILVANGVSSPVINLQLNDVNAITPKELSFTSLSFNFYIVNFPGFMPVTVKREGNTAAIVW